MLVIAQGNRSEYIWSLRTKKLGLVGNSKEHGREEGQSYQLLDKGDCILGHGGVGIQSLLDQTMHLQLVLNLQVNNNLELLYPIKNQK